MVGSGREGSRRATAVGMKVVAVRENPQKGPGSADAVYGPAQLDAAIPQADYILLCTPVTPATTGLMNRTRLGHMKPDAYLINVGRGPLLDDAALIEVLKEHKI